MFRRLRCVPTLGLVTLTAACGEAEVKRGDGAPAFDVRVVEHDVAAAEGIATGDYGTPSVVHGALAVDPKYRHVLNFQMTPMLPPFREPLPSSGPLILYSDHLETLVFSPLDHFYETVVELRDGRIEYGLHGEIDTVPEPFRHRFVVVEGDGIGATVDAWGARLMSEHGAVPVDRYADDGVARLGYWTDNGAYYYYRTEPDLNEAETMLAVKADADARDIPLGYLQLDSWWYFKESTGQNRLAGGLVRWEPQPEMFPQGLESFVNDLGLPLILHNRWFAKDNAYTGDFEFTSGDEMALPLERGVFDRFMADAVRWGAITYEQDWLMLQFWGVPHLRSGMGHAEKWIADLHDAAKDQGLTVQLTMPGPPHLLDRVRRPEVTSMRTSIDYAPGIAKQAFWPQFHVVNLVARAVGMLPFKDNFHSSETYGEAEALISILSAGMVGPGDQIGKMDRERLLRTCRSDGVLLKPDRPAAPIDAMFLPHRRPFTVATHSDHGTRRWWYVAAFHVARDVIPIADNIFAVASYDGQEPDQHYVLPDHVDDFTLDLERDLGVEETVVVWDARRRDARVVRGATQLSELTDPYDHAELVVAPVFSSGLALLGETAKAVTVADRRFVAIEPRAAGIDVELAGAPGEVVELLAYDVDADAPLPAVAVTLDGAGSARVTITR